MKQDYIKLDWDSDFFDYGVGKISGPLHDEADLRCFEELIHSNNSRLTYFSSPGELPESIVSGTELEVILADRKTTYVKQLEKNSETDPEILPAGDIDITDKHLALAVQSGVYSRFNKDKKIGTAKFEGLYKQWFINSITHKIAKEVLVYTMDAEIMAFVTLGEKNDRADMGIMAVDDSLRGKGIGRRLVKSAERWFADRGYTTIQVVTQGDNAPACKLYESSGYAIEQVEFFYHIWKND